MSITTTTMNSHYDTRSEESCPDYDVAMSSPRTRWLPSLPPPSLYDGRTSFAPRIPRALQTNICYLYHVPLVLATIPVDVFITVLPNSGKPASGKYTFKLSLRINKIERSLCDPVELSLTVDPKLLEFVALMIPGKTTLPIGGLWSLRVWLRVNNIDHKLFGEDEVWIGKDLNFLRIPDISVMRHKFTNPKEQVYSGYLGNAYVNFTVRWYNTSYGTIKYSLEYEAGGVSSTLFDDLEVCSDYDPKSITFEIYTLPINTRPSKSSHKLRVWLRSPVDTGLDPAIVMPPYTGSFVYQRVWKTDSFKIGSCLDFESLNNVIIGSSRPGEPQTVISTSSPIFSPSLHTRI